MHLLFAALLALSQMQQSQIDALVERLMRDRHVPGLSLGIARRGTRAYLRGYGVRDVGRRLPADGYTIYRIGSITKQFTAALILQDVAAGKITLGDPVGRYLPATAGASGSATIAQLLGQTSGIAAAGAPPAFDPGTGWQYDNANYLLLGMVLQSAGGVAYPTLLRERITAPFELVSTGLDVPPFASNVALGYAWHGAWEEVPRNAGDADRTFGAAAMVSNVPDLLRWLEDLRTGRVVPAPAFAMMAASGKLRNGILTHYGFGFFVPNWYGHRTIEHPGYVGGFSSEDALVLDDGLEVAVLANRDAVDLTPLTESIVALLNPPRDPNSYAVASRPPQNEDPRITTALSAIAQTSGFAAFGRLVSIEFVERSARSGGTYDKYRMTFASGQWWATVGYRESGAILSLTLTPIE
ncbi:MAG: serine hydrolase domain-containing protein [Candidatus Tumulicola sp.]